MGTAKVISLSVRPLRASHLCFNVDGILGGPLASTKGELPVPSLGAKVAAFPFDAFYDVLISAPTTPLGDKSRLFYDPTELQKHTAPYALATLRAEGRKLALYKAIDARQNVFHAKYKNKSVIIDKMNKYYASTLLVNGQVTPNPDSKPSRLVRLSHLANEQWEDLSKAYSHDHRKGVVKATMNSITSYSNSATGYFGVVQPAQAGKGVGEFVNPPQQGNWPELLADVDYDLTQEFNAGSSTIANTDYGYRVPFTEDQAKNERAQISLIDQEFAQFMAGQTLPNLDQVFTNELDSINMDVCRLQIAVLDTILMSPISGTVTGIYKRPGDFVRAGDPVICVEDSTTVLLVGKLVYPEPIPLFYEVNIQTKLLGSTPTTNPITGVVVAARGQGEEDQWDIVIEVPENVNSSGQPIFPLGYHFDYDDTTLTISPPFL